MNALFYVIVKFCLHVGIGLLWRPVLPIKVALYVNYV